MRDAGYGVIVGFQMEEKIEQAYLYDFYGELLSELPLHPKVIRGFN